MVVNATVCYIIKEGKILLIEKKRGIGAGFYNGPGGKIEPGEEIIDSAVREVQEEIGLDVIDPEIIGELDFFFGEEHFMKVHILKTENYKGTETETDEALPLWFDTKQLPFDKMWADDSYWMPLMFDGKKFKGKFFFDKDGKNLLKHELSEV